MVKISFSLLLGSILILCGCAHPVYCPPNVPSTIHTLGLSEHAVAITQTEGRFYKTLTPLVSKGVVYLPEGTTLSAITPFPRSSEKVALCASLPPDGSDWFPVSAAITDEGHNAYFSMVTLPRSCPYPLTPPEVPTTSASDGKTILR
jgi:hypothetical protein